MTFLKKLFLRSSTVGAVIVHDVSFLVILNEERLKESKRVQNEFRATEFIRKS